MANIPKRVKLYILDNDHQWIDKGTGRIMCIASNDQYSLKVLSEEDDTVLLNIIILSDTSFEKQQETLILWCDKNDDEFALSFQEKEACEAIWKIIRSVGGDNTVNADKSSSVIEESDDQEDDTSSFLLHLPPIDSNNLKNINEMICKFQTPSQKEKLSSAFLKANYINKLLDMFCSYETENNFEGLELLCEIFKHIVTLGNCSLFEEMFKKERILEVVGCFEYDKCMHTIKQHREFLSHNVQYKEVIPVLNPILLDKIHQTYHIQYFQDVILPSINALDESIFLSPFLYLNKVSIVNLIQEDEVFLQDVFQLLSSKTIDTVKRTNILLFLKELFSFAQNLQPSARELFYKNIIELKIIHALHISMQVSSEEIKLHAIEIFNFIVEYSPYLVRKYILEHATVMSEEISLITLLISGLTGEPDCDQSSSTYLAFLKLLLNPENMESSLTKSDKTDFLNYFYNNAMDVITKPILTISKDDDLNKTCLTVILELLEFCVEHHSYHIRNVILHKDLLRHVLKLMKSQYKILALSALRFIKKIIGLKDEFYNKYIIHGDLLQPVVEAFFQNQGRYNMLDSAILDMFEFIRTEELKSLCSYIMEHFGDVLNDVKYVQTFKCLRHTYEQNCLRNREKSIPIYLENCFKNEDNMCGELNYKTHEDKHEKENTASENGDCDDNSGSTYMEIDKQESSAMKTCVDSPRPQRFIVNCTPILRKIDRVRRIGLSSNSLNTNSTCRKRLVDYEFDDDDDIDENERKDEDEKEESKEFIFGKSKRVRLN